VVDVQEGKTLATVVTGRTGVKLLQAAGAGFATAVAGAVAQGQLPVSVIAGSGIYPGQIVTVPQGDTKAAVTADGTMACVYNSQTNDVTVIDLVAMKRDPAIEELVRIGPPAVPALLEVLNRKSWLVREGAVVVLGRLKEPRAIPAMMANLKLESGNSLRCASIKALQQMGPAATPDLIEALTGSDAAIPYGAAVALEDTQDERVVPGLLAAPRHLDPQVRR